MSIGPPLPSFTDYSPTTLLEGHKMAVDLLRAETTSIIGGGSGNFGEYAFQHHFPSQMDPTIGYVYDFPFREDTSFGGRMNRSYVGWLDGLTEVTHSEPNEGLRDCTALWLGNYVFWKEKRDPEVLRMLADE